jgi:hypothetical protein
MFNQLGDLQQMVYRQTVSDQIGLDLVQRRVFHGDDVLLLDLELLNS